MLRTARKSELTGWENDNDLVEMWRELNHPEVVIRWTPGKRGIYTGHWGIWMNWGVEDETGEVDDSPLWEAGWVYICSECGEIESDIGDGREDCWACGADAE